MRKNHISGYLKRVLAVACAAAMVATSVPTSVAFATESTGDNLTNETAQVDEPTNDTPATEEDTKTSGGGENTNTTDPEKSGEQNGQEMERLKEELENRMERISGTLLVGTQMFSQLQQRQCIAEATAKEQQCLVDYFAQLRPKRWQEWERKYSGLSTAQYIFLIMQDDLRFDDEAIAAILDVKRVSVRSMRARIKGRER